MTGFSPGTADHYRLVATNAAGATATAFDQTFITTQPPALDGLASDNLTATSAELNAKVNPNGLDTPIASNTARGPPMGNPRPFPTVDQR